MTDTRARPPSLGIIQLANEPIRHPGFLGHPATFDVPVTYATARDAWARRVIDGDPTLVPAYAAAARGLERDGAAAIITNCGFTITYQDELARVCGRPVATSALLLAPLAMRMIGERGLLGIVTADARALRREHLAAAGLTEEQIGRVVIGGLEDTAYGIASLQPDPVVDLDQLRADTLLVAHGLRSRHPELRAYLFECTALGSVADSVRADTRLPVFDVLGLARLVIDACGVSAAPS